MSCVLCQLTLAHAAVERHLLLTRFGHATFQSHLLSVQQLRCVVRKAVLCQNLMQTTTFSKCLMRCIILLQLVQLAVEHSSVKVSSLAAFLHVSLRRDIRSKSSSASATAKQVLSW